jgi:hypothetical protein
MQLKKRIEMLKERLFRWEALPSWVLLLVNVGYATISRLGDIQTANDVWAWIDNKTDFGAFLLDQWQWLTLLLAVIWLLVLASRPVVGGTQEANESAERAEQDLPLVDQQPTVMTPAFFRNRSEMNEATGGLLSEVRTARRVWYAGFAGEYARANGLYALQQFSRALLLDPYGQTISRLVAAVPGETLSHLQQTIEQATREAQAANVDVRWFDGPILGMTVLEPGDSDSSIRAEILVPFLLERPNFKVNHDDPLYATLLDAYEKAWSGAHPAVVLEPPTPDEQLVLLCNSYALPAFDALQPVLKAVYEQCFTTGGSLGLSATYFRDYAFQPHYGAALRNMQDCIAKGSPSELEDAFVRYCGIYLFAGAFVWHMSKIGTLADVAAIAQWVNRHDSLIDQVRILSGGIDRKGLATFLTLNHEYIPMPREVLEKASA